MTAPSSGVFYLFSRKTNCRLRGSSTAIGMTAPLPEVFCLSERGGLYVACFPIKVYLAHSVCQHVILFDGPVGYLLSRSYVSSGIPTFAARGLTQDLRVKRLVHICPGGRGEWAVYALFRNALISLCPGLG